MDASPSTYTTEWSGNMEAFLYLMVSLFFLFAAYVTMNTVYGDIGNGWSVLASVYMIFFCPALGVTWPWFFVFFGILVALPHIVVTCVSLAFLKSLLSN
jgi:hypothetical protein